jgi:hypothetical protein
MLTSMPPPCHYEAEARGPLAVDQHQRVLRRHRVQGGRRPPPPPLTELAVGTKFCIDGRLWISSVAVW